MALWEALFLSFIQGSTEFLPISSSGHLVLFQKILGFSQPPVFFDILLHTGSLLAVIIFFHQQILAMIKAKDKKILLFLILGTLPVAIVGYFLNSKIEAIFNSLKLVSLMWILFGIFILLSQKLIYKNRPNRKLEQITWSDALFIGAFQAIAIFPGVSRSGMTIIGSLLRKFSPKTSFFLSFILFIPAIFGALVLEIKNNSMDGTDLRLGFLSLVFTTIFSLIFLKILQDVLQSNKLYLFGIYCLCLGLLVFLIL